VDSGEYSGIITLAFVVCKANKSALYPSSNWKQLVCTTYTAFTASYDNHHYLRLHLCDVRWGLKLRYLGYKFVLRSVYLPSMRSLIWFTQPNPWTRWPSNASTTGPTVQVPSFCWFNLLSVTLSTRPLILACYSTVFLNVCHVIGH
jgi:hypothetical protein